MKKNTLCKFFEWFRFTFMNRPILTLILFCEFLNNWFCLLSCFLAIFELKKSTSKIKSISNITTSAVCPQQSIVWTSFVFIIQLTYIFLLGTFMVNTKIAKLFMLKNWNRTRAPKYIVSALISYWYIEYKQFMQIHNYFTCFKEKLNLTWSKNF